MNLKKMGKCREQVQGKLYRESQESSKVIKMKTKDYLKVLSEEIHSVVAATIDERGLPSTRVIDIMLYDDNGIYFLTAKGKIFYEQLMDKAYISLSGMMGGKDTMSRKAVTVSGSVRNIGSEKREEVFLKNPYMAEIYPTEESRSALEVFCLDKGQGQYFDLSTKPITRGNFAIGGKELQLSGFMITDSCTSCGSCLETCPQNCIEVGIPFEINQNHCLHCGNCYEVCPVDAVVKKI